MYRQQQKKKSDTPYCGIPHRITKMQGNRVTAARDGHTIVRHSTFFKKIKNHPSNSAQNIGDQQPITHPNPTDIDVDPSDIPPLHAIHDQPEAISAPAAHDPESEGEVDNESSSSDTVPYADTATSDEGESELPTTGRPARQRCRPAKLDEYEIDLPDSLMGGGSNVV